MTRGIYFIKNLVNEKMYIGSSNNIEARLSSRLSNMKKSAANSKLQADCDKYGIDSFTSGVLEEIIDGDLYEREIYYVQLYDSVNYGYNTSYPVVSGPVPVSTKLSNEINKKFRQSCNQKKISPSAWILEAVKEKLERENK